MHSTTTQPTPAPKPDAQPVQVTSFTPGPWTNKDTRVMTIEGNHVADCGTSYMIPDYEKHANARLIAAAPALLAALKAIHEAGRMSSQPRAVYCALIAEDALETAIGVAAVYLRQADELGTLSEEDQDTWVALRESLAAAQTIPSGEARKCAKCGFNISEYAVGEILCGACLNDQPCALCGHRYEAHEPDMQCHDGEAHGNRCACRTFVPSGEKE